MKNTQTRYGNGNQTLTIFMRGGKNGVNVGASVRTKLEGVEKQPKAITGASHRFTGEDAEAQARAQYEAMNTDASSKGWTVKVRPAAKPRTKRPTFEAIPAPGELEMSAPEPTAEAEETPAPRKRGRKANGSAQATA